MTFGTLKPYARFIVFLMVPFHCFARSFPYHWFDLAFFVCCTELEDALEELFTAIGTVTDPEGRLLSTWFQLVPHRTVRSTVPERRYIHQDVRFRSLPAA